MAIDHPDVERSPETSDVLKFVADIAISTDMSSIDPDTGAVVPGVGNWPVEPQQGMSVSRDRIWIDGCFDFSHHGHAGAMLQARRLGKELYVGVHSDLDILENKGPSVMDLDERVAAVEACRWASAVIPCAPYVTSLPWIDHYGCYFVVHGSDITSDSTGSDCYRFVKAAGRFLVVDRTPGISTTAIVGRMLLCMKTHFIKSFLGFLYGEKDDTVRPDQQEVSSDAMQRLIDYASDESGRKPGVDVWAWKPPSSHKGSAANEKQEIRPFNHLVNGKAPKSEQRVVYVDGGFDLFSSGHIEFLKLVVEAEYGEARARGWFDAETVLQRKERYGEDFPPVFVIAGVHDDEVINRWKGLNYPIMNIYERGLCVLQCRYINAVIFCAPFTPSIPYLQSLPCLGENKRTPDMVYHGPTNFIPLDYDPYVPAKSLGIFREIGRHRFAHVNAGNIVRRILKSREAFEERQRRKQYKELAELALTNKAAVT